MSDERRQHPRMRCYLPVRLYPKGQFKVIETLTKDLGKGGLCVVSPAFKPTYTPISVELVVGPAREPLTLKGEVVWFQVIPQSEQFRLGIEFHDVSPKYQLLLSTYIDRLASNSPVNLQS